MPDMPPTVTERPGRPPFRLGHYPALDGIRGVGLLLVIGFHLSEALWPAARPWLRTQHAYIAMDAFFVLSGFLITGVLLAAIDRHGHADLGRFLWRRGVRILPALVLLLGALMAAALLGHGPYGARQLAEDGAYITALVANWWGGEHLPNGLGHTWSLAVEGQFYVAWAVAVAATVTLAKRWPRQVMAGVAVAGIVAVGVIRSLRYAEGYHAFLLYLETPSRIDGPLVGALAGVAYASGWLDGVSRRTAAWLAAGGLVGLLVMPIWLKDSDAAFRLSLAVPVTTLCAGAMVTGLVLLPNTSPLNRLFGLRLLVFLGAISYGVYLWHLPIFVAVQGDLGDQPLTLQIGAALVASFAAGWLSYRYVERPLMHRATRRR
jgi:peptidoglycan/LPS O-acetylase OafA/YrhL